MHSTAARGRNTIRRYGVKKLIDYVVVNVYEGDPEPESEGALPSSDYLRGSVGYGVTDHKTSNTFDLSGIPAGKDYG